MNDKRLRIAFVTSIDARSKHAWSGTHYYIWNALQRNLGDVDLIGPVEPIFPLWLGKIMTGLSQKLFHKRYNYRHSTLLAKAYGKIVSRKLQKKKYDLVVVPATSTFIPFVNTTVPIAYIGDSTVRCTMDYYAALSNLYNFSKKETLVIEQKALDKSAFLCFSSQWASNSAITDFNINPSKVFTIPFGPNMDNIPDRMRVLERKKSGLCKLLFLGVDWERKGGSIAFDALVELQNRGLMAELTVCGCIPPTQFNHPQLKVIPFLDKNEATQQKQFEELFYQSDFLFVPTRRECFGVVFCEASAYGIPSISTDTGGVSSAVHEGVNGFLLPPTATGKEYAELIHQLYSTDATYYSLLRGSRELFESLLNWDTWAHSFKDAYLKTSAHIN